MFNPSDEKPREGPSIFAVVSVLLFVVVIGYLGWIFWSREQRDQAFMQRAAAEAAQRRSQDQQTFQGMGGNRFAILDFYANPGVISRGDRADLCYSVSNAKSVTLDPPAGAVWPSFDRCVNVSPSKTTTYMLTISDAQGSTQSSRVTVEVR